MISRRIFLKNGGLALLGTGMVPSFLFRTTLAASTAGGRRRILIVVFQRGGADGLNVVVPFREKEYYEKRPTIAIPAPSRGRESALDLDGFFALHPALKPLHDLYAGKQLSIIHAVGSPHSTRSHFDAQDFMESAAFGKKIRDGWLNRYLQQSPGGGTPFRAVSMGGELPRTLAGKAPAIAMSSIQRFDLETAHSSHFQTLYHQETDSLLSGTAREMFEAIEFLKRANPSQYQPRPGVEYPRGRFGENLKEVVQLIKAEVGLEVAFVDIDGWDHHINEGNLQGQLSNRLREFGNGLGALCRDLGDRMEDVVVLTMSEFGRTVHENGNAGTDHGHANVMFAIGGPVNGGKVYGEWPGLSREQLYEERDLALTTDFRDVFSEVLANHLNCQNANAVFPDFAVDHKRFRGFLARSPQTARSASSPDRTSRKLS